MKNEQVIGPKQSTETGEVEGMHKKTPVKVHFVQDRVAYVRREDQPDRLLVQDLTRPESSPVEMIDLLEG